jgi:hypothetical protein
MNEQNRMVGVDLKLQYTYPNGQVVVREHRVWDLVRFVEARQNEGRSAEKLEDRFTVKVVG